MKAVGVAKIDTSSNGLAKLEGDGVNQQQALDTSGRVIAGWNPEQEDHWDSGIAWRTLTVTTFSMIFAFCTWFLVSAIAAQLNGIGFSLSKSQLYWLTAIPGLSGGLIRLVYMFLPPIVGTRKLVGWTSVLLLIPMLGWYFALGNPSTPYGTLLLLSFLCGIGGGCFSGYMPSTGYFFPKRLSGTALNLQAGVGNLGMSFVQMLAPWLMGWALLGSTVMTPQHGPNGPVWVTNVAIFFVPWLIVAAIVAFLTLKDVPVKASVKQQLDIFGNSNTWLMTLEYIMTFGLFSGISAQFGLLINDNFGATSQFAEQGLSNLPVGAAYAFLGPLIGSLVRVAWGPLCDRFGGGIWTFVSGVGMAVTLGIAAIFLNPSTPSDFTPFLWAMLAMFVFAGIGNASTFKQLPMIMPKRQSGGAIGFTGGMAAFGPFFCGVALTALSAATFFWVCVGYCVICSIIAWVRYAGPHAPFKDTRAGLPNQPSQH